MKDYKRKAEIFQILSHPVRLQLLDELRKREACICHLQAVTGRPQAYVSQQLQLLRAADLVVDEKEGQNVFYYLKSHFVKVYFSKPWALQVHQAILLPAPVLSVLKRSDFIRFFYGDICKNIYIRSCSENYCNLTQFTTIWLRGIGCLPGGACIPVFAACIFHRWSAGCPNAKGGNHTVSRTECTEMDLVSCLCLRRFFSRCLFLHNYAFICQYL